MICLFSCLVRWRIYACATLCCWWMFMIMSLWSVTTGARNISLILSLLCSHTAGCWGERTHTHTYFLTHSFPSHHHHLHHCRHLHALYQTAEYLHICQCYLLWQRLYAYLMSQGPRSVNGPSRALSQSACSSLKALETCWPARHSATCHNTSLCKALLLKCAASHNLLHTFVFKSL